MRYNRIISYGRGTLPQLIDGKTVMLEAVKRQLKLTYDHAILSYVMSILGFLVAMILWGVMRSVLRQEAQYIPLGTIMALGLC